MSREALRDLIQSDVEFLRSRKGIIGKKWACPDPPEGVSVKPVPELENVWADTDGNIWTSFKGMWYQLPAKLNDRGYLTISVSQNGIRKHRNVHRLVALAYHGPCPENMVCRHLDSNSQNNSPGNLKWGTREENIADMKPTRNPKTIFDAEKRELACLLYIEGQGYRRIARHLGMQVGQVVKYLKGETHNGTHKFQFLLSAKIEYDALMKHLETRNQECRGAAHPTVAFLLGDAQQKLSRLQILLDTSGNLDELNHEN